MADSRILVWIFVIIHTVLSAKVRMPDSGIETRKLSIPQAPSRSRQTVEGNFQSYSIEFSYMLDYAGNDSSPNTFSNKLLQNLYEISGVYPIVRAGGTTENRAIFVANQSQALIEDFDPVNADQPSSLSIGPAWMQSFHQFPKGTKYVYGLNFNDGESGLLQTVLEARYAFGAIQDDLYAFEIGNEVDGFPCTSHRPCNWTIPSYVEQWQQYAAAISSEDIGSRLDKKIEPLFQGCNFEAPRRLGYNETPYWNVESALRSGIAETGKIKTVADHDYMGAACEGSPTPTIAGNLLNHFHMTSLMYYHEVLGSYAASVGVPYVLGETNSISCQGTTGISDVYAAALWAIDYTLYVAALPISRMYYHMGTRYRYSPWQPVEWDGVGAHVKPLYYGNLFTATAFAGGNKQVEVLINETSFTAYAVYEGRETLKSVVLVNLAMWNSTQPAFQRPFTAVKLPSSLSTGVVSRFTSPGVEIAGNISFAGQMVDATGNIVGRRATEKVHKGRVLIGAGEALLISL